MGTIINKTKVRGISETWDVLGELLPQPPGTVLDAGCGEHVWEAAGATIARCDNWQDYRGVRQRPPGVDCVDLQRSWPYENQQFDGVIASDVIEHLENIWHFFREAFRVAKRYVIITTPNTTSAMSRELFRKHGYLWGFHPEELRGSHHISPIFEWQIQRACDLAKWWQLTKVGFAHRPLRQEVVDQYGIEEGLKEDNCRMLIAKMERTK
jgi:hypothetical protein